MRLECQQCGNYEAFDRVWDYVEVRQEVDASGNNLGDKMMSIDDTDGPESEFECAWCGVRSLVIDVSEQD